MEDEDHVFGFEQNENPFVKRGKDWFGRLKTYLQQNQLVAGCAVAVVILAIFGIAFAINANRSANSSAQNNTDASQSADEASSSADTANFTITSPTETPMPSESASPSATPNTAADQSHSSFSVNPSSVPADGTSLASITITIANSNGQIISGLAVSLTTSDQRAVFTPLSTGSNVTDLSGHATFSVSSTNVGTDQISVVTTTPDGVSTTLPNIGSVTFTTPSGQSPTPSPTPSPSPSPS